jgi:hypothetical protein
MTVEQRNPMLLARQHHVSRRSFAFGASERITFAATGIRLSPRQVFFAKRRGAPMLRLAHRRQDRRYLARTARNFGDGYPCGKGFGDNAILLLRAKATSVPNAGADLHSLNR